MKNQNIFLEHHIFDWRKKVYIFLESDPESDPDPLFPKPDPDQMIRIHNTDKRTWPLRLQDYFCYPASCIIEKIVSVCPLPVLIEDFLLSKQIHFDRIVHNILLSYIPQTDILNIDYLATN